MQLQQWILLAAGLVVIFLGVCLMAYSVRAKRAFAGAEEPESGWAQVISALAGLLKAVGNFIGANAAARVGFLLIVVGFVLLYFAFRVA
jgi:uncharacterized membrane protein